MFEYTPLVDFGLMMWPILFNLLASYLLQHKSVSAGGGALNVDSPATDWQPVQGTFLPLIKLTAENGSPETIKLM